MIRKLFCIGFHKTATTSLQRALERLGLRCLGYDPSLMMRYDAGDLDAILDVVPRYDAFRDWPWPLVYRELAERVPDAGFLLTVREPARWLASLKRHSERTGPTATRRMIYGEEMPHGHEERYLNVYNRHNASVIQFFGGTPNFMMLRVEDGLNYEPLCRFLGKPAVAEAFPHLYRTDCREEKAG